MKKMRFLNIFSVLLALVLFFPGCDSDNTNSNQPASKYNGSLFVKQVDKATNTCVYVSIYSNTTISGIIKPEVGKTYSYASALAKFDQYDDIIGEPEIKSRGTVTVNANGNLIFKPNEGSTCTGTLSGNTLTMDRVPGTTYYTVELEYNRSTTSASPNSPLGTAPLIPGGEDPPPTSPTNPPADPNAPLPAADGKYVPGKIPISFKVEVEPNWGPLPSISTDRTIMAYYNSNTTPKNRRLYFEGDKFSLAHTGIRVVVNYNDGTSDTWMNDEVLEHFYVEPPEFRLKNSPAKYKSQPGQSSFFNSAFSYSVSITSNTETVEYKLFYKEGFGNSSILGTIPTVSNSWTLTSIHGPPNGNIFPIREITYTAGTSSLLEWLEDEVRVFPNGRVKDITNKDTDVYVSVKWWGSDYAWSYPPSGSDWTWNNSLGVVSIENGNYSSTHEDRGINWHTRGVQDFKLQDRNFELSNTNNLQAAKASAPAIFNVKIGSWEVPFSVNAFREVDKIVKSGSLDTKQQVIFDDPRLWGDEKNPLKNLHWLNKLTGGGITISYLGTKTTRTRSMLEAFNIQGLNFIEYNQTPFTTAKGSIAVNYFKDRIVGYEVPVYSNLVGIRIEPTSSNKPYPILLAAQKHDQDSFLKDMVTVYALYERGKGGTTVERQDTWGQIKGRLANDQNQSCEGDFDSNIAGLLTKATINYLKTPPVPTTVRVGFTPRGSTRKYTDAQIYAVGYN
jgi:hypothetical protein